ncbi:MAG: chromosomal replication initiator protein DnaA [Bacteroidaceae bacterium]|nr:chromosomal replication initiator protein DnaA [Bacteroidaceae bacterium]
MAESPQIMWKRCLDIIRNNVNEQQFETWFSPLQFKSFDVQTKELTVYVPSQYFHEYLEEKFSRLWRPAIIRIFGSETRLFYDVNVASDETVHMESDNTNAETRQATSKPANQAPSTLQAVGTAQDLDSQLNTKQNFSNFIEGLSNKLPRSVGQAIAEDPNQQAFNPLFIFGPSGVGKTHLVNAIGTRVKELHPQKRVLYLSANLFQVQYTDSVRRNTFNDFMHFYQSIDVLIMDDVQELMGETKAKTQYAFFHIFNHLRQNGKQIILTSDRPPVALQGMEDRLITRFKCGLLAELERPEEQLRHDILVSMIRRDGLNIPQDVIDYISMNVSDSVRELEGVIHCLLAYSVVYNRDVDMELAKRVIRHSVRTEKKALTMEQIVECTCEHCHVRQEDVYGKSRKAKIVQARQLSMYFAQQLTKLTTSKIGTLVGNRNHATVIHSVKTIENLLNIDKEFRKSVEELENKLKHRK